MKKNKKILLCSDMPENSCFDDDIGNNKVVKKKVISNITSLHACAKFLMEVSYASVFSVSHDDHSSTLIRNFSYSY